MPILVMGLFFRLAGPQSPWWIRPLISFVTGQLAQKVVFPRLKNHTRIVSGAYSKEGPLLTYLSLKVVSVELNGSLVVSTLPQQTST